MKYQDLFDRFDEEGKLVLPAGGSVDFAGIPWTRHASFEGVELKHIVTAARTGGAFSYHLVRIAPGMRIGEHIHAEQIETHEAIAGNGICTVGGAETVYRPGSISILPKAVPHEVTAGSEGLYLFAKFIPALI